MSVTSILCWSAAGLGAIHTALGPDHYLPFVAMSRSGDWSTRKTLVVTVLCGLGHVAGSIVLGVVGVALGTAVFKLESIEAARGEIATWMLIGFGLCFFSWSVIQMIRGRTHVHWHSHGSGTVHCHEHRHDASHLHVHEGAAAAGTGVSMTPWILFTIFVFGPCEPLIPLLMYPAASGSAWLLVSVTLIFASATVLTMTTIVWVSIAAPFRFLPLRFGKFAQPAAGLLILGCGIAMKSGL